MSLQEEVGCKTVFSLGGLQFLQSLKTDISLDCHPVIDSILEQLYLNCHSSEPTADLKQVLYQQQPLLSDDKEQNTVSGVNKTSSGE